MYKFDKYDLIHLQKTSILEMLQIASGNAWKVLIYDSQGKDIIAPLFKVGDLRQQGVTLNLSLEDSRGKIPGIEAIYLIGDDKKSISRFVKDAEDRLYSKFHLNFCSSVQDTTLKELAKTALERDCVSSISTITDRYLHFIAVSPTCFTLNLKDGFRCYYGNTTEDISDRFDLKVINRLMSVMLTLGTIPYILVPKTNTPAKSVGVKLAECISNLLKSKSNKNSSASVNMLSALSGSNRSTLIILDRTIDLSSMIMHSWVYEHLIHDIYGIQLNRVLINKDTYELANDDFFFNSSRSLPLSRVATKIAECLEDYNSKVGNITKDNNESTIGLASAIKSLPEITLQKKILDMHTKIATALVDQVKNNSVDKVYEFECDVYGYTDKQAIAELDKLIDNEKIRPQDKFRAFLCFVLAKPHIRGWELDTFTLRLESLGIKTKAIETIENIEKARAYIETLAKKQVSVNNQPESTSSSSISNPIAQRHLSTISSKLFDTGVHLIQGARNLLKSKDQNVIVSLVEHMLQASKNEGIGDKFTTIDPRDLESQVKYPPCKLVTVFVLGGGNFSESNSLVELGQKTGHHIIYGTTFMDRPEQFIEQFEPLKK